MTVHNEINICIGGEAGQGLITLGELLSKSLVRSGFNIAVTQEYMSRIRGGHNTFAIRAGSGQILAPRESIDILVALNKETVILQRNQLSPHALILTDAAHGAPAELCLLVPYKDLTSGKFENIAALGVVAALLGIKESVAAETVRQFLGKKSDLIDSNLAALAAGWAWADKHAGSVFRLPPPAEYPGKLMLNGNDAIALGALSAGLKFCAFYPMTPSTSIPQTLARYDQDFNLVVEQAEDEIAAINMAIGASFCGAPSMVATSGGGFALMVEGVSLAGMTETPVVIVVGQRPGPATGLPTRTEQADLDFVLHAGHGEFPRAVYAPGSVEECFWLTREAFAIAERFQGPVFILTDQFIADSYRAVLPFKLSEETSPSVQIENFSGAFYRRFAFTETGVSPRLLPGMSAHLVVADSDEHTEDGHITEDLGIRERMVEKRQNKLRGIVSRVIPPEFEGDAAPDLLLISWGSAKGAVREAASVKKTEGLKVGLLHFRQVWPLAPAGFMEHLKSAKKTVCVESNAIGQFARLIRRECGFEIKNHVRRYDGLAITPEYILRNLSHD